MVEFCTSVRAFYLFIDIINTGAKLLESFFSLLFPEITVDFVARANFPFSNMTPCWKMRRPWGRGWDTTMRNQYSNFSCVKLLQLPEFQRLPWTVFLDLYNKKNKSSVLFIVYFMDQSYIDSGLEAILCCPVEVHKRQKNKQINK